MRRRPPWRSWLLAAAAAVTSSVVAASATARLTIHDAPAGTSSSAPGAAARPLSTAILDPSSLAGPEGDIAHEHARAAGIRFIRLFVNWMNAAPRGDSKPTAFDARNPGDPLYQWTATDRQVRMAVEKGYAPVVYVQTAPAWAQLCSLGPGPCRPSPADLADFMTAAATRYSGRFEGLPRVRYWQVWNEPNLDRYLMPQADASGRTLSPEVYRPMVNAAYDAIHAVHPDNVVIAGGTAPFGDKGEELGETPPLLFMRKLLCLSTRARPRPVCRNRVKFDVWAHHPYTSGNPTHHADRPDNISVPDLWKMRVLLEAATKAGNLTSRGPVRFWVTEFGWDTSPPDPKGVPEELHARWVAEALYRMWDQGVSLVTWFLIRDQPFTPSTPFQSGLYFRGDAGIASDKPKLALTAFRFPFVAFREPKTKTIMYWGRSPAGRAQVIVEQQLSGEWRVVATLTPNRHGIFTGRYPSTARRGFLRARLANGKDAALPFSLVVPPDRPGCAWGTC